MAGCGVGSMMYGVLAMAISRGSRTDYILRP